MVARVLDRAAQQRGYRQPQIVDGQINLVGEVPPRLDSYVLAKSALAPTISGFGPRTPDEVIRVAASLRATDANVGYSVRSPDGRRRGVSLGASEAGALLSVFVPTERGADPHVRAALIDGTFAVLNLRAGAEVEADGAVTIVADDADLRLAPDMRDRNQNGPTYAVLGTGSGQRDVNQIHLWGLPFLDGFAGYVSAVEAVANVVAPSVKEARLRASFSSESYAAVRSVLAGSSFGPWSVWFTGRPRRSARELVEGGGRGENSFSQFSRSTRRAARSWHRSIPLALGPSSKSNSPPHGPSNGRILKLSSSICSKMTSSSTSHRLDLESAHTDPYQSPQSSEINSTTFCVVTWK